MADGMLQTQDTNLANNAGDIKVNIWKLVKESPQTPFISCAIAAFLGLTGVVFYHTFSDNKLLAESEARMIWVLASSLFWFPIILLFRDPRANLGKVPRLRLPVICLTILITFTLLVVLESYGVVNLIGLYAPDAGLGQGIGYSCLALAFGPLVWNAINFYRHRKAAKKNILAYSKTIDENVESESQAMNALIATIMVLVVIALAYYAGKYGQEFYISSIIGIGLCLVVAAVFAIVVFLEQISRFFSHVKLYKLVQVLIVILLYVGRFFERIYSCLDMLLVRIGAFVAGMEHDKIWSRYCILAITLLCLCILSWYLPPTMGIFSSIIGLVLAISVSRLWGWVEDDRALAVMTEFSPTAPYRTQMKEDYRDETLLGFIFVFALLPIFLAQIHLSGYFGEGMFQTPPDPSFLDWVGFFGIELAKAVPIVDWAEIYQFQNANGGNVIQMSDNVTSRHAVFVARAAVDLVLIAALLQALSIANRNRQQKQLYRAGIDPNKQDRPGLIDRLDVFVEQIELERAVKLTKRKNAPKIAKDSDITKQDANKIYFDLRRLTGSSCIDFRRYNADRLQEIYANPKNLEVKIFIAAIAHERGNDLPLKDKLDLLQEYADQQRPESYLYRLLEGLKKDILKHRVEVDIEALRTVLLHVRKRAGLKDFKQEVISLMVEQQAKDEVMEYLADIAGSSKDRDDFQYTRRFAIRQIEKISFSEKSLHKLRLAKNHLKNIAAGERAQAVLREIKSTLYRIEVALGDT